MELSSSSIKKLLVLFLISGNGNSKNIFTFHETETLKASYISKDKKICPEKIIVFVNYCIKWNFLAPEKLLKNFWPQKT